MNIFRVLASGKQTFREEFVSAFLAYLLSPKMDHGLGARVLSSLLEEIGSCPDASSWTNLARNFGDKLRNDLFSDEAASVNVELELNTGVDGVIDIVVNYDNWFIMIENKIYHQSIRPKQVEKQYYGLKNLLKQKGIQNPKILKTNHLKSVHSARLGLTNPSHFPGKVAGFVNPARAIFV
jgi:hypothetical protein